jgi:peptide/nickel transport system permease protein
MFAYIVRRLIGCVLMLIVMSMTVFLIFYGTPTDPARLTCGKNCTAQGIEQNRHYLGLDQPIAEQYWDFVKGLFVDREFPPDSTYAASHPELIVHCAAPCLGYSPLLNTLIWTYLKPRIPVTIYLSLAAFLMWITSGVLLGVIAALRRGKISDRVIVSGALIFYSFPVFFVGLLLFQILCFQWKVLPVPNYVPPSQNFGKFLEGLFLPGMTLALTFAAAYVRITRTYMLETMGEDYLRTARSKGVKERTIVFKHTLRAALTPIVTIAGLDLAILLAGAPITETIFSYQGVGQASVQAATEFDLPMTVVIVLLASAFVVVLNLVVDVLYGVIDPRVRY